MSSSRHPSIIKRSIAGTFDLFTAFSIGGYAIGKLTGNTSETGFQLNGMPAVFLLGFVFTYYIVCSGY